MLMYSVVANNLNPHMSPRERIEQLKSVIVALLLFKSYQMFPKNLLVIERYSSINDMCFIPFYEENICLVNNTL